MERTDIVVPARLPVIEEEFSISKVAEAGREIGSSWRKAAAQVLETATRCDQALTQYGSKSLPVLIRAAQMSKATFLKLAVIGRDRRLQAIKELLPPGFSLIYAVSQLNDATFNEAVKAGLIHPHVRRAEIEALRKPSTQIRKQKNNVELPTDATEINAGGRYEFAVPKDIRPDQCARMKRIIEALQKKFRVDIVSIKELDGSNEAAPANPPKLGGSPVNRAVGGTHNVTAGKQTVARSEK